VKAGMPDATGALYSLDWDVEGASLPI
jgi:hypothetical protein